MPNCVFSQFLYNPFQIKDFLTEKGHRVRSGLTTSPCAPKSLVNYWIITLSALRQLKPEGQELLWIAEVNATVLFIRQPVNNIRL